VIQPYINYLGRPVLSLQTMLRSLYTGEHPLPLTAADGVFGEGTLESVMIYQRDHGLPVTGVVDADTWASIAAAFRAEAARRTAAPYLLPEENGAPSLTQDMAQAMFAALSTQLSGPQVCDQPQLFDQVLRQNLLWLQERALLPQTGVLDWKTSMFLSQLYLLSLALQKT